MNFMYFWYVYSFFKTKTSNLIYFKDIIFCMKQSIDDEKL